jgi:hypothetical protein
MQVATRGGTAYFRIIPVSGAAMLPGSGPPLRKEVHFTWVVATPRYLVGGCSMKN